MRGYLKTLNWVFKFKTKRTTIGKHKDSDLCLQNGGVDECHAIIDWCEEESCYYISDLNSVHGTYVNDCRIHNATVRLSPGDQLHFGYGGSTYELIIDSKKPFPFLSARSVTPQAWVQTQTSSIKPHPPTRTRPMSAGSKQVTFTPDRKTYSKRPGSWSANTERSCYLRNKNSPHHTPNIYILPVEVERSHRPLEGCGAASVCLEDESPKKDDVIACLKKEVSALKLQLSQKQTDPEVTHRLCCLESDIREKKEQIQQLKEQMLELQACSGEMLGQALIERDQKISNLSVQLDKLKSENKSSKAMVSSLQKDLTAREKQALNLAAEVDKLRENVKHKDAKLTNTIDKLKEAQKHQHELLSKQNIIESFKKEQASLLTEMDRLKHLHQQTQQREQRIQAELKHKESRLDSFHKQIVKAAHLNSDKVSDQEVLVCFSKLMEQMETYKSKLHDCDTKLEEETRAQRKMLDETQMFRAKLEECQTRVQDTCMADTVHMEISALEDMNLSPALSWVQAHSLSVLNLLHALLHKAAQRLQTAGIDVSVKTGGVLGALQILSQEHKDNQSELRNVKAEIQKLQDREMQNRDLQNKLDFMQKQSETDKLQAAERQKEIKNTTTHHLEEVKADLHSVRKTEDALRREIETCKAEWLSKMEEAKVRETELKEKICDLQLREEEKNERMKQCEEREMRALQRGAEEEREIHRVEVEEYREQVRQHAYTIVAMEKQINKVQQSEDRWREMEKQRDSLEEQLKETLKKVEDFESNNTSYISEKEQKLERTITSLRSSLVASQQEVAGQSEIINALSRDLAQAHARHSDMSGELSEQQKIELETHRALVLEQRIQLSTLTHKLTAMSQLVEQKDEEKKKLAEKLKQTEEDLRRTAASTELESSSLQTTRTTRDVALMTAPNDVINLGSKHKGYRCEEMILQQQEGLRDVKERISALQKKWPSTRQQGVPERRGEMKTQKLQRSETRKGSNSSVIGFAFPEALTEAARERTARLDMSDALELSEKTYLELARVLCEALELSEGELSGSASLKHLPPDERLHIYSQRQTDLEFLRSRLDLQNTQSQQQDLLLEENQREINTLRESLILGHQMQAELASMKVELETQRQESEQLRQTLQDYMDQLQRNQQKHSVAIRNNQGLDLERSNRRTVRVGHHNCIPNESYIKTPALKKQSSKWRIKNRGSAVETPKQELLKEHQTCSMVSDLAGPLQVPDGSLLHLLTEAN
ncbi:forkhead-associated domain-containing protein 1 isoform X1 [Triplophysa dalaica]|uniref:forkhead-associated domain-containing protein 1 isoform X1 n=1 Tax=Triplophysa dalaica TaxID=1582913 RepID=UPI0024DFD4BD|nr:forkhead-associated domain-containing protein 1 isoform X1 [Triplophysa dalaica]XP_056628438.1 forkhead-associated domain-containing protein 1 isoform X1 [Triplophysa dalaica]